MKTIATAIATAITIAWLSAPVPAAHAQGGEGNAGGWGWAPVKRLEFTDDDVRGGLLGPEGERIEAVERAPQPSLIELRAGFEAEVVKTMEDM